MKYMTMCCWFIYAQNNRQPISWKRDLYTGGSGTSKEVPGLSTVPKLKYEHVSLAYFSFKMQVDFAAQVGCHLK